MSHPSLARNPKVTDQRSSPVQSKAESLPSPAEANVYAQKLNNSAAFCIEVGEYDRAISSLGRALRLSELYKDKEMEDSCIDYHCSIDGCISYSEQISASVRRTTEHSSDSRVACSPRIKKRRLSPASRHSFFKGHLKPQEDSRDEPLSFYRRPIHVTPSSMTEDHNMGSTLFLIIVFNLALAHHCVAHASSHCGEDKRRRMIQTTSKIYELVGEWYERYKKHRCDFGYNHQAGQSHPDRFGMILHNNSSHVYFLLNDREKYEDSLQQLTSALMLAVDHKKTRVQQFQTVHNQEQEHEQDELYCDDDKAFLRRDNLHIEEFWLTASQAILCKQCADAA